MMKITPIALLFLASSTVLQASNIVVTYVQNLDLVNAITGARVPGLDGHPAITWTFNLQNFLDGSELYTGCVFGGCFSNPVLNQDAINDGIVAPIKQSFMAIFSPGLLIYEVDAPISFRGITYFTNGVSVGTACFQPCSQVPYGNVYKGWDNSEPFGPNFRGYSPLTGDTIVGVLVHNPEPSTIILVSLALLIAWSRRMHLGRMSG